MPTINLCLIVWVYLLSIEHQKELVNLSQKNSIVDKEIHGVGTRLTQVESVAKNFFMNESSNGYIINEMNKMKANFTYVRSEMSDMEYRVRKVAQNAHNEIKQEVQDVKKDMNIYVQVTNAQMSAESNFVRYQIAGTFTLLACLISMFSITSHLRTMNKPDVQRRVLAILWMIPIYSVTSWLSLVFPVGRHTFTAIRDIYEAYCVYTFIAFLIAVVGEEEGLSGARLKIEQRIIMGEIEAQERTPDALEELEGGNNTLRSPGMGIVEDTVPAEPAVPPETTDGHDWISREAAAASPSVLELTPFARSVGAHERRASEGGCCADSGRAAHSVRHSLAFRRGSVSVSAQGGGGRMSGWLPGCGKSATTESRLRPPLECICCEEKGDAGRVAASILFQCQVMALQFVLLKPVLAVIPLILQKAGVDYYGVPMLTEKSWPNLLSVRMYMHVILNVSVAMAFWGLVSFYHAVQRELSWCDPWPKFVAIKMVVFVTFWQQLALDGMNAAGVVDEESARAAQNLLVCIEMLVASLAFYYCYPAFEWEPGYKKKKQEESLLLGNTLALFWWSLPIDFASGFFFTQISLFPSLLFSSLLLLVLLIL